VSHRYHRDRTRLDGLIDSQPLVDMASMAMRRWRSGSNNAAADRTAALLRITDSIEDYLYTNEHLPDGSRRSVYSGANRERLLGGEVPDGLDVATEWERRIVPEDWPAHLAHRDRLRGGEPSEVVYRLLGYDGVTRWICARTRPSRVGGRLFVDGIVSDITKRVEAEEALVASREELRQQMELNEYQALHDALTGLANRRKLLIDLDGVTTPGRSGHTLVLCDLDGFKLYNDSFGHPAGDALLVRLSRRLERLVDGAGTAYRLGGDEFCLILPGALDDRLRQALATTLTEKGEGFEVTAAWGEARIPSEARTPDAALSLTDRRLYESKQGGRRSTSRQIADVLTSALTERDETLGMHLQDVAELASLVGIKLRLPPDELNDLRQAAQLHDLGKMAIPDQILQKAGPLERDEWQFMCQHPAIGERIIATAPCLRATATIVRSSHERFDGGGYPDGLEGRAIPLPSRIIAVCDAFVAMIGDRPYRKGISPAHALEELHRNAGTQFDPEVVTAFAHVYRERELPQLLAS
jgi:diguanylate cyclase (GGDEF)-like protein